MTDEEHAAAVREAARVFADAVNAASADGLEIGVSFLPYNRFGRASAIQPDIQIVRPIPDKVL